MVVLVALNKKKKNAVKGTEASWSGIIVFYNSLILSEKAKLAPPGMWNARYDSVFNIERLSSSKKNF